MPRLTIPPHRIKTLMREHRIGSYAELAEILGMDRTTTWRVLTGRAQAGPAFLHALKHRLGVDLDTHAA